MSALNVVMASVPDYPVMVKPDTPAPPSYATERPFDYAHPTPDELRAVLGSRNWVIARRTPRIVARYGEDVLCLSPKAYAKAEAEAIARRGWARYAEKVIRDLMDLIPENVTNGSLGFETTYGKVAPAFAAAREVLALAKKP